MKNFTLLTNYDPDIYINQPSTFLCVQLYLYGQNSLVSLYGLNHVLVERSLERNHHPTKMHYINNKI